MLLTVVVSDLLVLGCWRCVFDGKIVQRRDAPRSAHITAGGGLQVLVGLIPGILILIAQSRRYPQVSDCQGPIPS